jgi:hypothetical protein
MKTLPVRGLLPLCLTLLLALPGCKEQTDDPLADNAGGRRPEDFPELAEDVFAPMDGGVALSPDEVKGRNTWNLWCGGDEQFWDRMAREGYGLIDLLRTIDSRQRGTRFRDMGLINEPGFRQASKPDEYGLWIDEAVQPEPASIDPRVYGRPTGIMGFRLFPNPDFDEKARRRWDAARFYGDADYAVAPDLVRPYRVGVSCGACHIAFNPVRPPADPSNPRWENLASAIGNQYIREGRVFAHNVKPGGLFWEMLAAQPPGTSDTSRIATDHINNPNTINPIFELGARLAEAHTESISGEALLLPGVQARMPVPHVLKDGADSVGVPGATLRVYINIGMYSQHWLRQHDKLLGLRPQKPFEISTAQKNSVYWMATQAKFANIAAFFTRLKPMLLSDAPGGRTHMTQDPAVLQRGKLAFADNCAGCHSSKRPPEGAEPKAWFREAVLRDDFAAGNFFSDERRHPVTKIGTNAARAFGSNAKAGHIWQNFSSDTYKNQPSPGSIRVYNPYTDSMQEVAVPAGGSGYYRTPSLISLWSSAPFLHNNALGIFTGDPSVEGRLRAFDDAVGKLLWPSRRLGKASIWRTTRECNLQLQVAALPAPLALVLKPHADADGYFRLGPIPEGTPINLVANINPEADPADLLRLCLALKESFAAIKLRGLDADESKALLREKVAPALFAVSTCPDLVEDRGHEYGVELSDQDKLALIEYLKTL